MAIKKENKKFTYNDQKEEVERILEDIQNEPMPTEEEVIAEEKLHTTFEDELVNFAKNLADKKKSGIIVKEEDEDE